MHVAGGKALTVDPKIRVLWGWRLCHTRAISGPSPSSDFFCVHIVHGYMVSISPEDRNRVTLVLLSAAIAEVGCVYLIQTNNALPVLQFVSSATVELSQLILTAGLAASSVLQVLSITLFRERFFAQLSQKRNPVLHYSRLLWAAASYTVYSASHSESLGKAVSNIIMYLIVNQSLITHDFKQQSLTGTSYTTLTASQTLTGYATVTLPGMAAAVLSSLVGSAPQGGQAMLLSGLTSGSGVGDALITILTVLAPSTSHLGAQYLHFVYQVATRVVVCATT